MHPVSSFSFLVFNEKILSKIGEYACIFFKDELPSFPPPS
jgi:hypothetical protein